MSAGVAFILVDDSDDINDDNDANEEEKELKQFIKDCFDNLPTEENENKLNLSKYF